MATKFKLSRKVNPPRLACSPLRRRIGTKRVAFTQPGTGAAGGDQASLPLPVVAMSFKNAGVRRIVGQYTQMEGELMSLRRRYFEARHKVKSLRATMKEQRTKSRQLIVSCAFKLQENEKEMQKFHLQRREELAAIDRELLFLHSNMIKEQTRLKEIIARKEELITQQARELDALRLEAHRELATARVDTPVSSPDSSPNRVPKFKIREKKSKGGDDDDDDSRLMMPPPLPPPPSRNNKTSQRVSVPIRGQDPDQAFLCSRQNNVTWARPALRERQQHYCRSRSSSSIIDCVADKVKNCNLKASEDTVSIGDEGFSSSHEEQQHHHHHQRRRQEEEEQQQQPSRLILQTNNDNNNNNNKENEEQTSHFGAFLASSGLSHRSLISPSVTTTNHRTMKKPSDVKNHNINKHRDKLCFPKKLSCGQLAVVEEHQVCSGNGSVKAVTYWTKESFL